MNVHGEYHKPTPLHDVLQTHIISSALLNSFFPTILPNPLSSNTIFLLNIAYATLVCFRCTILI